MCKWACPGRSNRPRPPRCFLAHCNGRTAYPPTPNPTWTFPGYGHGVLPDGNYYASLPVDAISDVADNQSTAEFTLDFFVLAGDLNRDRQVSISDFIDLASNFNKTSATYTDGDLSYDGSVTISDFIDLAANFNKSLPQPAPAAQPAATALLLAPAKAKRHRHYHRR
ncbi:MAG TPA: hypothetical protein VGP94_05160 [Tepidisphaeraceae bacterium]|nr:hypothetical protein [Tepidisphaeraceae bacterium]